LAVSLPRRNVAGVVVFRQCKLVVEAFRIGPNRFAQAFDLVGSCPASGTYGGQVVF
jgi:hypothetical protein